MKNIRLLFFLMIGCSGGTYANPDAIVGIWLTQIQDVKVEIYALETKYFGRVIWLAEPNDEAGNPKLDEKNPDNGLKTRTIMQMVFLNNFVFKDNKWIGGTIYDPKVGEVYSCKLWLEHGNLMVRGYMGWLYDTKTWTKA